MSVNKIIALLSLLHTIDGIELPQVPTAVSKLAPRQLFAGCGLNFNIWGQISPISASGHANLCLQCRVNVLGFPLSFSFYDALSTSISGHGVSASDAAVLQSCIGDDLLQLSPAAKTSLSCTAACSRDKRCASSSFVGGICHLNSVDYVSQNRAGGPLSDAFQKLYSTGGPRYCSICPNDQTCGASPSGLPRRSIPEGGLKACPSALTACPLTPTKSFTSSTPFECLDVSQELTSCGGCTTLGRGVDCSALKGVATSGCSEGNCKIFTCKVGYQYSPVYNICHKSHRASKMKL